MPPTTPPTHRKTMLEVNARRNSRAEVEKKIQIRSDVVELWLNLSPLWSEKPAAKLQWLSEESWIYASAFVHSSNFFF